MKKIPYSEEIVIAEFNPSNANPADLPAGYYAKIHKRRWKFWINTANQTVWHRSNPRDNTWTQLPLGGGSTTTFTDNANGTMTSSSGASIQQSIRPLNELAALVGAFDTTNDRLLVYDFSSNSHVVVTPSSIIPRASNIIPLADGQNDGRTGSAGTLTSLTYAAQDHIHPIVAIVAPAQPVLTLGTGSTMTFSVASITAPETQEEHVTYYLRVTCNIPAHTNVWQYLNIPNIAGYKTPVTTVEGTYRQTGTPTGYPASPTMNIEATAWTPNLLYVGGLTENAATVRNVILTIRYTIV